MQIMNHVDILELIKITVFRPNVYKPTEFQIDLQPLDQNKRVVVDSHELQSLNHILLEKCQQFDNARDPKVAKYMEEFVAKMCSEWHRMGLLILEDIPEAAKDPYYTAKELVR